MKTSNRTYIVSGGSSGLGLATVKNLVDSGNTYVSILDQKPPLESLPNTKFIELDITDAQKIQSAIDDTVQWTQTTGAPLGGVVNCAGVGTVHKIINAENEPFPLDLWNFTIEVNLTGSFNLTRLALKELVKVKPEDTPDGERGVIIFVASSAAFEGQPGQAAYSASKGALVSMTLPLARDLARHHIRVMTIAPSPFASAMTAHMPDKAKNSLLRDAVYPRRFGEPEEFASTVRWILETGFVNGETVRLSGAGRMPARM
ncbi:3-hydroxyacyl-CoA dehydrogenase [Flagelloscypha sp. PMI_526]|nr:3-hydroxyacyl-CoA dehydrogenase [Flagelloscypha sp. PMI_526]